MSENLKYKPSECIDFTIQTELLDDFLEELKESGLEVEIK